MSAVARGGEVDGIRLLGPDSIDLIFREQQNGVDLVLGRPVRWGIGYALPRPDGVAPYIPDGKICFWGGWGGSVIIMDAGRRMTISYARNKMDPANMRSDRTTEYCKAIFDAVTSS
jgi:CubicO group peptidase (beta-lactamase class C family)